MPDEKLKALYNATSQDYNLGTYEEFSAKMQDPEKRKAYYGAVGQKYNLGSFEEFEGKVAPDNSPGVLEAVGQRIASPGIFEQLAEKAPKLGQNPALNFIADKAINILDLPLRAIISALPNKEGDTTTFSKALAEGRGLGETAVGVTPEVATAAFTTLNTLGIVPATGLTAEEKANVLNIAGEIGLDAFITGNLGPKLLGLAKEINPKQAAELGKAIAAADGAAVVKVIDDLPEAAKPMAVDIVEQVKPTLNTREQVAMKAFKESAGREPIELERLEVMRQIESGQPPVLAGTQVGRQAKNLAAEVPDGAKISAKPPKSPTIDAPSKSLDIPEAPAKPPATAKTAADEAVIPKAEKEVKQTPLSDETIPPEQERSAQALGIVPRPTDLVPKKVRTIIREALQDSQRRVKQLQETKGVKLEGGGRDPYETEIRFHGRVQSRLDEVEKTVDNIDKSILEASKEINISDKELNDQVSRYLTAKHAPEYNAQHGANAAGITDDEAAQILADIESLPHSSKIKNIGKSIQDLNKRTLDILLDGEVIDKDLHTLLRDRYKEYVPFQRLFDDIPDDELVDVLTGGSGFSVAGSGIKRAKGSEREIGDILANSMANVQQAIVRAEKNRVGLATLRFSRNNPQLGVFSEVKPKVIGTAGKGKPITNADKLLRDKNILVVREQGKPVYLKISDPALANAIKGTNKEQLGTISRGINVITKWVTQTATRFNPAFQVPNILRDTQEMTAFLIAEKNFGNMGALATQKRIPQSMKDVFDALFREIDTPGTRLYKQMQKDGGTTGGMALNTRQKVKLDVDKLRQLNRSKPRKAAKEIAKFFDNYNAVFEDATRLSVYKEALSRGLTREEAAVLAKEATINFNRKGTLGSQFNALYAFANASIQGSTKMIKALKNPKVLGTVTSSVFGAVLLQNQVNDAIDPEWRDKVPSWERNNNLVIVLPSDDGSFHRLLIPVSWGIKPIKTMADYFIDISSGVNRGSKKDIALGIAASALDAYNPIGGSNLRQAITPTFLDVPGDLAANEAWYGKPIKPDNRFYPNLPEHKKYFRSLGETGGGRFLINTTEFLNERYGISISPQDMKYAIEQMGGGTAKFGVQVYDKALALGGDPENSAAETPIINRFYKSTPEDVIDRWKDSAKLDDPELKRLQEQSDLQGWERTVKVRESFDRYKEAKTDVERRAIRKELLNHDPKAYQSLKRRIFDDKRGVSFYDSILKDLEPEFRAERVMIEIERSENKQARFEELKKSKVINKETYRILKDKGLDKLLGEQ